MVLNFDFNCSGCNWGFYVLVIIKVVNLNFEIVIDLERLLSDDGIVCILDRLFNAWRESFLFFLFLFVFLVIRRRSILRSFKVVMRVQNHYWAKSSRTLINLTTTVSSERRLELPMRALRVLTHSLPLFTHYFTVAINYLPLWPDLPITLPKVDDVSVAVLALLLLKWCTAARWQDGTGPLGQICRGRGMFWVLCCFINTANGFLILAWKVALSFLVTTLDVGILSAWISLL